MRWPTLRELRGHIDSDERTARTTTYFDAYQETLARDRRHLLRRFSVADGALKVVGVGSVGTRCWIVLLTGHDHGESLFLQVKEADASVLEPYLPPSKYRNPGDRVVEGRRLVQASSSIFLGWAPSPDADRDYYWHLFLDMKASADVAAMSPQRLGDHGQVCGRALAHAHARSGDAAAIGGHLGGGRTCAEALAEFAVAHADQIEDMVASEEEPVGIPWSVTSRLRRAAQSRTRRKLPTDLPNRRSVMQDGQPSATDGIEAAVYRRCRPSGGGSGMARRTIGTWALVTAMVAALLGTAIPGTAAAAEVDTVVLQADTFSRTVPAGWGDAEVGGSWQLGGSGEASVDGAQGLLGVPQGATRTATLGESISGPAGVKVGLSFPELPTTGDASAGVTLRQDGERLYYARVRVLPTGDAFLAVRGQLEPGVSWLLSQEVRLGRTVAGSTISLIVGSEVDDTLVTAKAWLDGEEEPTDWQVRALDPDLPDAGTIGLLASAATDTPYLQVAFDDYELLQQGENLPPEADFSVAADGLTITVDGSASSDPDGTIAAHSWDFGDGSSATGATPAPKTYAANGTYTVALTVTDDQGATGTTTQQIVVAANNVAPMPSFITAIDDLTVTVDGSESTDSDGEILGWLWEYGDGSTSEEEQPDPYTYAAAGEYTIELTVTDNEGAKASIEQQVVVTDNVAPVSRFLFTSRDRALYVDGRVSTDSDGEISSYAWDYGDGTTAKGAVPKIHTYAEGGEYEVALTVTDDNGAENTSTQTVAIAGAGGGGPVADRGAELPIIYNLSDLPGTKRFVAPNGSNETGDGSEAKPYRTLQRAFDLSKAGDSVVVRGGTYEIEKSAITKNNITVAAYPGETPIFDGSMPAPTEVGTEGGLKFIDYLPMPAKAGEGLNVNQLPEASFDGSGNPTGLANERGWKCVSSSGSYSRTVLATDAEVDIPYDEPQTRAAGSGCSSGSTPRVITGLYPDQVWVDGEPLVQVHDKSRVKKGFFFVPRESASDVNPSRTKLYLSPEDAADISKVRVSKSSDNFLIVQGDGVTMRGLRVQRHSPAWPFFAMTVTSGTDDFTAEDMEFSFITSVATKVAGGDSAGGGSINDNPTMNRVTIDHSSWIGTSQLYTDDGTVSNSIITNSNYDREFKTAPKSGGIKATKTHRMAVINSDISENNGHGIWWDQSNYDATLADSDLRENSDSALFYEISHGLAMVNNIVTRNGSPSSSPTIRLAGASGVIAVNNTIVGGQVPFALAGDPRSKSYGSNRLCSEHTERYRQGGSISSDCPPALSSDLDKARPGAFGSPNLTPELNWRPSAIIIVNNVFANPVPGSGGICPGGYPLCIKAYSGPSSKPDLTIPANQILPKDLIMDGNIYQSKGAVAEVLAASGQQGGFTAQSVAELRGSKGLGSSFFGLNAEPNGLDGEGYVTPDGEETPKLVALHGDATAVPNDPRVTPYLDAGTQHYGALRDGNEGELPANLPNAVFTAAVSGNTVSVDASGSTYDAGTIAGYLWDFGDDTGIEVGQQVEHVYAEPGTYTVALGVVGTNGAFDIATQTVVILDPDTDVIAEDTFTRLESGGWGSADVGGMWEVSGNAAKYSVDGDRGAFDLSPGQSLRVALPGAATDQADLSVLTGTGEQVTGGGIFLSAMPRLLPDGSAYRAKVGVKADGTTTLQVTRLDAGGKETVLASAPAGSNLTGVTAGTPLRIRSQALGSSPTTLRAKIWKDTEAEPADWQVTATDGTAALQTAAGSGLFAYQSSSATSPVEWLFDEYRVLPADGAPSEPPPAEPEPVAEDTFDRTERSAWGDAVAGGTWEVSGNPDQYSVNGAEGVFGLQPGKSLRATLTGATTDAADLTVTVGAEEEITASGVYLSAMPRYLSDGSAYRAKINVRGDGTTTLSLTRVNDNGQETVIAAAPRSVNLRGLPQGSRVAIRAQADGTSPTTLRAKIWVAGQEEPADWQVTATDDTAALQQPGGSGLFAYESSSSAGPLPLLFEDFAVRPLQ